MKRFLMTVFSLLVCLASCSTALAQRETGSIAGLVTDVSQAAVPGAEVAVRNLATGTERRT